MKPKTYVAIALMTAALAAGLIIIVGLSSMRLLPVYLLSFLLIYFTACIVMARKSLKEKLKDKNIIFAACIILAMLAISATFFLTNLKTYYDAVNTDSLQLSQMQSQNDYYAKYITYLDQKIMIYQNQTKVMENKLAELQKNKQLQTQKETLVLNQSITPQITIPETSYITYPNYRSREGNDD